MATVSPEKCNLYLSPVWPFCPQRNATCISYLYGRMCPQRNATCVSHLYGRMCPQEKCNLCLSPVWPLCPQRNATWRASTADGVDVTKTVADVRKVSTAVAAREGECDGPCRLLHVHNDSHQSNLQISLKVARLNSVEISSVDPSCRTRWRTDVPCMVFLCVPNVCVRTAHCAVPGDVATYHTRCFFVCRTCVYEQYTVPYQKT